MKKLTSFSLFALLLIVGFIGAGCGTTGGNQPASISSTPTPVGETAPAAPPVRPPVFSQQTLADASVVLRSSSRAAAVLAIQDNLDNRKYVDLAVAALDTFLVGDDYAPGALVAALEPVLKKVSDPKIGLAVNSVTDIYEVFYGRYVKNLLKDKQPTAYLFVKALRDGASSALDLTAPPTK